MGAENSPFAGVLKPKPGSCGPREEALRGRVESRGPMSKAAPLFTLPAGGAARLRTVLDDAGFTAAGVAETVGGDLIGFGRRMAPILLRRTAGPGSLPALIRLFLGLVPVPPPGAAARL